MATTAKEILAKEKTRQAVRKETYKAMLDQLCRKIRSASDLGQHECIVTVPPFIVGFPKYDLARAVLYMCRQFQRLGYIVDLVGPFDIQVAWRAYKHGQEYAQEEEDPLVHLPSLANLQKTAQKLRITKKK